LNKEHKFNQLVKENEERIKRICKYYSNNSSAQEDMFQEILINIWKSLDTFEGRSSINTWIYRIAVNTSLTFTSKTYKRMDLIISKETNFINEFYNIEDDHPNDVLLDQLQIELNQLSVIDKALISLVLENQSIKEIANIIGITESNVKTKIHRIKRNLKDKLYNYGN